MNLEIRVTSRNIGSNPGGRCVLPVYGVPTPAYLKYCNIARLTGGSSFRAEHQPIYEALTVALARCFGLEVPNFYVLLNGKHNISFAYDLKVNRLNDQKPFYFVSELVDLPHSGQDEAMKLKTALADDKIYRDFLLISDVSGRRQNFAYFAEPEPHVLYIDLGCSFVDSVEGILQHRKGKKVEGSKRQLRGIRKEAENRFLISRDNTDLISFLDLIDNIDMIDLPTLNPEGVLKVKTVLTTEEMEEIQAILYLNLPECFKKYKSSNLLVQN